MIKGEAVHAAIQIDAPPETVFAYFVEPEKVLSWLGQWCELDPRAGGRLALDIRGTPVRGEFVEIDAGRRLLLAWGHAGSDALPPGSSLVEITFVERDGGTLVQLVHRDLPSSQRDSHRRGWALLFDELSTVAAVRAA